MLISFCSSSSSSRGRPTTTTHIDSVIYAQRLSLTSPPPSSGEFSGAKLNRRRQENGGCCVGQMFLDVPAFLVLGVFHTSSKPRERYTNHTTSRRGSCVFWVNVRVASLMENAGCWSFLGDGRSRIFFLEYNKRIARQM